MATEAVVSWWSRNNIPPSGLRLLSSRATAECGQEGPLVPGLFTPVGRGRSGEHIGAPKPVAGELGELGLSGGMSHEDAENQHEALGYQGLASGWGFPSQPKEISMRGGLTEMTSRKRWAGLGCQPLYG